MTSVDLHNCPEETLTIFGMAQRHHEVLPSFVELGVLCLYHLFREDPKPHASFLAELRYMNDQVLNFWGFLHGLAKFIKEAFELHIKLLDVIPE